MPVSPLMLSNLLLNNLSSPDIVSFMARPLRIEYPGAIYHVMNRGASRQPVFHSKSDKEVFLKTLEETHETWGIEVFAYCLMNNHYHLCLKTPQGNLSRVMRHLDGVYTQRFNRKYGKDGALFRGRYKSILIDAEEYLTAVIRYIHLNPIGALLVKFPEDYEWSSHRGFLNPRGAPPWLKTEEVLGRFGGVDAFHKFVLAGNDSTLEKFYDSGRQSSVLGGEKFLVGIRQQVEGKVDREHPRYERRGMAPMVGEVIGAVAKAYGVSRENVLRGIRGKENEPRKVAMFLVKRFCNLTLNETVGHFGVRSYGVIGWASHVIQQDILNNKKLKSKVDRLQMEISQQKICPQ